MLYSELKKGLLNFHTIVIILLALVLAIFIAYLPIKYYNSDNQKTEKYYKEYINRLEGKISKEKADYVVKEKKFIEDTISNEENMLTSYNDNKINSRDYQKYLDDDFYANEHSSAIDKIYQQYERINKQKKKGIQLFFVYDTYWNYFFDMKVITVIQMLLVIFIILDLSHKEYTSGMKLMTDTYYNGRVKLVNTKIAGSIICSCTISVLFSVAQIIFYFATYDMPGKSAPIQSISKFENFPVKMSIMTFVILICVIRIVTLGILGMVVYLISFIFKNSMVAYIICGGIVILPMLFANISKAVLNISIYEFTLVLGILGRSTSVSGILLKFGIFVTVTIALYVVIISRQYSEDRKK